MHNKKSTDFTVCCKGHITKLAQHSFSNLAWQGFFLALTEHCEGGSHNREEGEGRADSKKWKSKNQSRFYFDYSNVHPTSKHYLQWGGNGNTKKLCLESEY